MVLVDKQNFYQKVDCTPVEVYDVTGAGDTDIAYLGACIANQLSMQQSINISNIAGCLQVSKKGTSSLCIEEINQTLIAQTEKHLNTFKITTENDFDIIKKKQYKKSCFYKRLF